MIREHLKLLNKKDALVRRQDYLNVLSEFNTTNEKILQIQEMLAQPFESSMNSERNQEKLMIQLKELTDLKNDLSNVLLDKELE